MRCQLTAKFDRTLSIIVYNTLIQDMRNHINTVKIDKDQFIKGTLRYRHLSNPSVYFLARKLEGAAIGAVLSDANFHVTNMYLAFKPTYVGKSIKVTFMLYPYAFNHIDAVVCIATRNATTGVITYHDETIVHLGSTKIDPILLRGLAVLNQFHYYTAVGGYVPNSTVRLWCVITSGTFGVGGIAANVNIDRYYLAVRTPLATTNISNYDVCYGFAIAKDSV